MKKLILISIVVLLAACTENIKYTVKAGEHRSCNKVTFLKMMLLVTASRLIVPGFGKLPY